MLTVARGAALQLVHLRRLQRLLLLLLLLHEQRLVPRQARLVQQVPRQQALRLACGGRRLQRDTSSSNM